MKNLNHTRKNERKTTGVRNVLIVLASIIIFHACAENYSRHVMLEEKCYEVAPRPIAKHESPDEAEMDFNTEEYGRVHENPFLDAMGNPLSTFSIDVDNASYSNVRRFLNNSMLPPPDAVRIEEMINYFSYNYPDPQGRHPFSFITEVQQCPWNKDNLLVHIGIQGKKPDYAELKPSNLVFLVDVSDSMGDPNKLPLLKKSFNLLLPGLGENDRVSIVVYAGAAGVVLEPTRATDQKAIKRALRKLEAGGSTAGGEGIELAYKLASKSFIKEGNNRVILATDGDFNIGTSSTGDLVRLIEEKRKKGIYLTICGFGMGNYKDGRMEQISNAGNGNYFYIDNIAEAEKVFVKEMRANLFTIAKDVKIQVEFNPNIVDSYRLIGYENRLLRKEDFVDDTKDAGELGAGHTVTALYELVPASQATRVKATNNLKYQSSNLKVNNNELMMLKFRYKPIDSEESILIEKPVLYTSTGSAPGSINFRFSAAVAGFGMLLRQSAYTGDMDYNDILALANPVTSATPEETRKEFISLVKKAELLSR